MNVAERLLLIRLETRTYVQKIKIYGQERVDFNYFLGYPPNPFNLKGSILCESTPLTKPEDEGNCLEFGKFRIHQQDEAGVEVPLQMHKNVDQADSNVSQIKQMALIVTNDLHLHEDDEEFLEKIGCEKENILKVKSDKKEKVFLVGRDDDFEAFIDSVEGEGWTASIYPLWTIHPNEQHQLVLNILWDAKYGLVHHRMIPLACNMPQVFQNLYVGTIGHVCIENEKINSVKKIFLTTEEERFPNGTKSHFDDYGFIKKWIKKEAGGLRWIEAHFKRAEDAASAVDDSVTQDGIDFERGKVFCLRDNKMSKQSRKRGPTSPLPQTVPTTRSKMDEERRLTRKFSSSLTTREQGRTEQLSAGPSGVATSSVHTGRSAKLPESTEQTSAGPSGVATSSVLHDVEEDEDLSA